MSHDVSRCLTVSHPASQISGRGCHWPSELQASRLVLLGSDLDSQANACRPEFHRISLQTRWVGNNSTISRSAPKLSKPHYHPPPVLHPKSHLFLGRIRIRIKIRSELSSSSSWPSPSWCYLSLSLSGNSSSPAVPLQNDLLHLLDLRFHRIIPHPFAEAGLHKGHDENQSCSAQILGLQWDSMGLKERSSTSQPLSWCWC